MLLLTLSDQGVGKGRGCLGDGGWGREGGALVCRRHWCLSPEIMTVCFPPFGSVAPIPRRQCPQGSELSRWAGAAPSLCLRLCGLSGAKVLAQVPLVYLAPGFKELKRCPLVPLQLVQPVCISEVQHVLHPKSLNSGPSPRTSQASQGAAAVERPSSRWPSSCWPSSPGHGA